MANIEELKSSRQSQKINIKSSKQKEKEVVSVRTCVRVRAQRRECKAWGRERKKKKIGWWEKEKVRKLVTMREKEGER